LRSNSDSVTLGTSEITRRGGTVTGLTPTAAGNSLVDNQYDFAGYLSYQLTEKMSLHGRVDWYRQQGAGGGPAQASANNNVLAWTGTVQYDLWANVISRLEARWDYSDDVAYGNVSDLQHNAFLIAANIIYNF
jgi:hypothetical protein